MLPIRMTDEALPYEEGTEMEARLKEIAQVRGLIGDAWQKAFEFFNKTKVIEIFPPNKVEFVPDIGDTTDWENGLISDETGETRRLHYDAFEKAEGEDRNWVDNVVVEIRPSGETIVLLSPSSCEGNSLGISFALKKYDGDEDILVYFTDPNPSSKLMKDFAGGDVKSFDSFCKF